MQTLKPAPVTMIGGLIASLGERPVWDVVLDDDGAEAVPNVVSKVTITVVSAVETATDTWTVILSDDASTTIVGLTKTGTVGITSSTEDGGENSEIFDAVLEDGDAEVAITEAGVAPIVGSFAYYLAGTPGEQHDPTWLHLTAAEFAKWM